MAVFAIPVFAMAVFAIAVPESKHTARFCIFNDDRFRFAPLFVFRS